MEAIALPAAHHYQEFLDVCLTYLRAPAHSEYERTVGPEIIAACDDVPALNDLYFLAAWMVEREVS